MGRREVENPSKEIDWAGYSGGVDKKNGRIDVEIGNKFLIL